MSSGVEFRQARESDLEGMHAVYVSVVAWIRSRGETHWPIEKLGVETLREWVGRDEAFVACIDGVIVGGAWVQRSDPDVWPDRDDGCAVYIHKLAVARDFKGQNVGREMLDAVERRAADEGLSAVRLDTAMVNSWLVGYYRDAGYTRVDIVERPPVPLGRFEKRLKFEN